MTAISPHSRFVLVALVALGLTGPARAEEPTNEKCPVMPDEKASTQYKAQHKGRTVYFCCDWCVKKFISNPTPYSANLEPAPEATPPAPVAPKPNPKIKTGWEWLGPVFAATEYCERHPGLAIYLGTIGLLVAVAVRVRRQTECAGHNRLARWLAPLRRPGTVAVLVLIGLCAELWRLKERADEEVTKARSAAATAPPVREPVVEKAPNTVSTKLLHWAWPQALEALPKGLKNTYYRGNDERSPKLFNGGDYRTVTFNVAVRTEDGRDLTPGTNLTDRTPRMRLEIVRAPNTARNFFKAGPMSEVFLAPLGENARGAAELKTDVPEQRWSVEVPFDGPVPAKDYARLNGVWGLCIGNPKSGPARATIHYYVQCVLHTQNGIVQPESSAWMVPVYPSPILHCPTADREWFSDRPIPEIPDGKNVTDPKLLGLPEEKNDGPK
jgi:YHS domain-containing protein